MSQFKPKRMGKLRPWVGELGRNPKANVAHQEVSDTGLVDNDGKPIMSTKVWNRAARRERWQQVRASM